MNLNKEHIDEPGLKQVAAGYKNAQGWRQRGETSVDEQKGETNWSFWDKLTVDSAQALKVVLDLPLSGGNSGDPLKMTQYIDKPELFKTRPLYGSTKKELVDVTRQILLRESPLSAFLEAQLGYNRSAGGSGIGLEMGERWHYRVLNWWLSEEKGDNRGSTGGMEVNSDVAMLVRFITIKGSWTEDASIMDEAWRQSRGMRDAGASDNLPRLIITS